MRVTRRRRRRFVTCCSTSMNPTRASSTCRVTMVDLSQQKQTEDDLRRQYEIVAQLGNTFLGTAEDLKHYSEELEARVRERTAELRDANLDAIYMLAVACEAKDQDTGEHVRRI